MMSEHKIVVPSQMAEDFQQQNDYAKLDAVYNTSNAEQGKNGISNKMGYYKRNLGLSPPASTMASSRTIPVKNSASKPQAMTNRTKNVIGSISLLPSVYHQDKEGVELSTQKVTTIQQTAAATDKNMASN